MSNVKHERARLVGLFSQTAKQNHERKHDYPSVPGEAVEALDAYAEAVRHETMQSVFYALGRVGTEDMERAAAHLSEWFSVERDEDTKPTKWDELRG